jgi:hypothetical protein
MLYYIYAYSPVFNYVESYLYAFAELFPISISLISLLLKGLYNSCYNQLPLLMQTIDL